MADRRERGLWRRSVAADVPVGLMTAAAAVPSWVRTDVAHLLPVAVAAAQVDVAPGWVVVTPVRVVAAPILIVDFLPILYT